ncbi:MauE/DoxX family redox-associated membrane protein [Peribacillus simplex]|uniref:MauE/DoxX family redox-associated membrane protein n=1 Tax=Peribacillus simplex TaxID=1478 RepID=UPI003CF6CF59
MELILQFAFMFYGYMFITTGFSKIKNISKHYTTVYAYNILPKSYIPYFVWFDTILEFALGISLITGTFLIYSIPLSICLLAIYTAAILKNLLNGVTQIDCGCGGAVGEHKLSYTLVIRNFCLIIILIVFYMSLSNFEYLKVGTYKFDDSYFLIHTILISIILALYKISDLQSISSHLKKV